MFSGSEEDVSSRDVFIQAQTGSGKTLAFLLPILQDLLPLSSHSYIDRSIGTLAIIIAPTRELAKQISDVLESLLKLRLRQTDEVPDDAESSAPRLTRWLVSGLLSGGATRTHEKARLRKGLPILVSTPGRLLDHLQNTSSLNVGKCRWLVLDEADRLMDLGFEETIQGIIKGLDGRRNLAKNAVEEGKSMEVGGWDWERRRRTILCSATIRDDVQKLAGTTLLDPLMIKATNDETVNPIVDVTGSKLGTAAVEEKFTPPSQLSQKYVVIPLKLRLVALIALLRSLLTQSQGRKGTKIIVFLSCTDSVDFHWNLLGGMSMSSDGSNESSDGEQSSDEEVDKPTKEKVALQSTLLPDTSIYRLHGSLPLQTRLSSLRGFSSSPKPGSESSAKSSILLCTSVASRGLDLPLVRAVVQYDLPTESGATEYVHRVGRTARAGKGGEAWSFVAPSEVEWVKWVTERMRGASEVGNDTKSASLEAVGVDSVLQNGFGGKGSEYEDRATEVQLSFERWVLKKNQVCAVPDTSWCTSLTNRLRTQSLPERPSYLTSERMQLTPQTRSICFTYGIFISAISRKHLLFVKPPRQSKIRGTKQRTQNLEANQTSRQVSLPWQRVGRKQSGHRIMTLMRLNGAWKKWSESKVVSRRKVGRWLAVERLNFRLLRVTFWSKWVIGHELRSVLPFLP